MRALVVSLDAAASFLARAAPAAETGGWRDLPGFDFAVGIAGCAAIVWISKWIGRRFVQRPEGYYDERSP